MMLSLLSLLLLVPAALSNPVVKIHNPPINLPLVVRINATGSANIVEMDRARARSFLKASRDMAERVKAGDLSSGAVIGVPVTNAAVTYTASVGVGYPATQYNLLIDTGSSNTWVGAGTPYVRTSTSTQTCNNVLVRYGSGNFSGTEFIDRVTLAPGLVIKSQSIGVASNSSGFEDVDGILGIGPVDLTNGTLSPDNTTLIPTVTDNLFSQGSITANEIGISFEPTTSLSSRNGELTFGGTDSSKFTGSITFTGLTGTSHANKFWGIDQSIRYGNSTIIQNITAGIVDTGTTLILLTTPAFNSYKAATGGVLDDATGLLRVTPDQFANMKSLFFNVNGTTYELTANAQLWPRALNTQINGTADSLYLIVGDLGPSSEVGFDFVNGFAFLERFYSVFDTTHHRVGFATTPYTWATTN